MVRLPGRCGQDRGKMRAREERRWTAFTISAACMASARWSARRTSRPFTRRGRRRWWPSCAPPARAGLYNIDEFRHGIERMDPAHYLGSSYFEHWLDGIARILAEKGVVTTGEMEARTAFFGARPDAPASAAVTAPPSAPSAARSPGERDLLSRGHGAAPLRRGRGGDGAQHPPGGSHAASAIRARQAR